MLLVNSLLFLVLCLAGLYFLLNEGRMIDNPFVKNQKYFVTGPQIFLLVTLATGMFRFGEFGVVRLSVWIAYLFVGIVIMKGKVKFSAATGFYALYILYLFASLFLLAPDKWFGLRVIAKYIFPLFILMFAAKATNSEFIVFSGVKYLLAITVVIVILFMFWLPLTKIFWGMSTLCDHLVVVCAISIALFFATSKKRYLWFLLFFFAYPVIAVVRTGLIGITACLSVFFLFKYKWRAVPVILLVVVSAVLIVLYVPGVREKMFRKQMAAEEIFENIDNLTLKDIDTNGRQAMWEWSLENFYQKNKTYGVGVGNLQMVFYSESNPFGDMRIVHNDFIQILCDNGTVGLILYLLACFSIVLHSFFIYNNKQNNEMIKLCAVVAGSSMIGILCTSYTDNAVNYTLATYCYPFAFYGMALGLIQKYGR